LVVTEYIVLQKSQNRTPEINIRGKAFFRDIMPGAATVAEAKFPRHP
jgi:hypothetical protein